MAYSPYLAKTSLYPVDLPIVSAHGSYLEGSDGRQYLDLISGIGVNYVGHSHPHVLQRIKGQLEQHSHVMVFGEYPQGIQDALAEKLISITGPPFEQVFFTNSGTEANEAALKLAKRSTGRTQICSFRGAYHGSTHGSLSVSGNEERKRAFRPLLPDVKFLNFDNIEDLSQISTETAAVIIEPIQGDAGVRIPSLEFMRRLRSVCSEVGSILIFDEIQTGFGRTGDWFAYQHFEVVPDILCLGKALGAGMPLGALVSTKALMENFTSQPSLGHITTFGGNPVCCASGLGGIEVVEQEHLIKGVERKGGLIESLLDHPQIREIRRKGLMIAVDLESAEAVNRVVARCRKKGVLIYWFLSTPTSFRIAPPLTISEEDIHQGVKILLKSL